MQNFQHPDWDGVFKPETRWAHWCRLVSVAGLMMAMGGVVCSPALLSIGTVAMVLPAFAAFPLREQLQRFWNHKPAVLFSLIFFVHILSGLWTRDTSLYIYLDLIKIKAPLLFSAYSLAVLGPFPLRWIRIVLMLLLLGCFITSVGTVVDYALHKEAIEADIQNSKEIDVWTGINHIYFSIICGFSTLSVIWLLRFRNPALFRGEKILVSILGLANFVNMHVMTTRTGLVGMYLTVMLLGFIWMIREKKYLLGVVALTVLLAMPIAGYYGVKSFKLRLENTVVDLTRYFSGKDPNYLSIGTRIESWKAALHLYQKNPLLGVGMADIKEGMVAQYLEDETRLCPENFVMPHNQFLINLAGYGSLGIIAFSLGWLFPVFQRRIPKSWLFWAFWILMTLAMLGESVLERQVGVNFTVPMLMLSLGAGVSWPGQDKATWR